MQTRLPKIVRFARRVLRDFFFRNHGLLLTAAVAYNMMLSLIPVSAVLLVIFSHFYDQSMVLDMISREVSLIAPGFTATLSEVLVGFVGSRQLIGVVGGISLLIFSSFAFRVLEDAFSIIFHRPLAPLRRKAWVSALMPYLFILIIAGGLIVITTMIAIIDVQSQRIHSILGINVMLHEHLHWVIYGTGVLGLVMLFTMFYKLMPVVKISFRRALIGGLTATILWELVRHLLVTYYAKVSMVNVLYGSMATIIIVLLTLEAIAFILLLGAQVIANLQHSGNANVPWYEDPDALPDAVAPDNKFVK